MNERLKRKLVEFFSKRDLRSAGLFAIAGAIAGVLVGLYMEASLGTLLSPEELAEIMGAMPESKFLRALMGAFQVGLITLVLSFIGLKFARVLGLKFSIVEAFANGEPIPNVSQDGARRTVLLGLLVGLVIIVAERFYFQARIPVIAETAPSFSLVGLLSGIFYGGIVEEVMLRLFLMSVLLWAVARLFGGKDLLRIPTAIVWGVIVVVALIFAALHLPSASLFFGELTGLLVFRLMLLNTLGGIVYGWLYWKYGIEYAIAAHMLSHIGMQLLFIPVFYQI